MKGKLGGTRYVWGGESEGAGDVLKEVFWEDLGTGGLWGRYGAMLGLGFDSLLISGL